MFESLKGPFSGRKIRTQNHDSITQSQLLLCCPLLCRLITIKETAPRFIWSSDALFFRIVPQFSDCTLLATQRWSNTEPAWSNALPDHHHRWFKSLLNTTTKLVSGAGARFLKLLIYLIDNVHTSRIKVELLKGLTCPGATLSHTTTHMYLKWSSSL